MFNEINEPIDVIVKFMGNKVVPLKFLWNGREIVVSKINLVYSSVAGRTKFYYFSVSDMANYYKLQLNTDSLEWTLLENYVE